MKKSTIKNRKLLSAW